MIRDQHVNPGVFFNPKCVGNPTFAFLQVIHEGASMKRIMIGLLMGLAVTASAQSKADLDNRIGTLVTKFVAMQEDPKTRVSPGDLQRADGIVLLDRTRGGLGFAYQAGNGIAMVKDPGGHWSPAAFVSSTGASLGLQAGGEKDFFVVLLTSPQTAQALTRQTIDFGAKAGGTGVDRAETVQANTVPTTSVMVYGEHYGLFGGASVKGGAISPDNKANAAYYGHPVSMQGILYNHQVQPTRADKNLVMEIDEYSAMPANRKK